MLKKPTGLLAVVLLVINTCDGRSSPIDPFASYDHEIELAPNVADLWWTVGDNETNILFELHIKTTGWIALGISPAGGMKGADIGVGWVDQSGNIHFQDRYAVNTSKPILDNTTTDWIALQGCEQNGWTAIQFKRALDTCDEMDVPIKSGSNNLIYAYGLVDPDSCHANGDITYHQSRRGSRILPLRSYANPPPEEKFIGLDYFDFRLNNYVVSAKETTYHCKVYKSPAKYLVKRHVIAHKVLIESANRDLVHHLLLLECNPSATFDDNSLPDGLCDDMIVDVAKCATSIATTWAVGGDEIVEFPEIAGYPVGGDRTTKYYMIQMHYDNPNLISNRRDSTGIRFYVGNKLRQNDIGYLALGVASSPNGLAIPPKVNQFIVDSYCSSNTTEKFPESGIKVISSFPHTHLQGRSIWTKLIRNKKAVQYLFNAEAFDFNYQYENLLPKPVELYPGDEFATRCVYNTMNKNEITLGGEGTHEEMCLHILTYYPRMNSSYMCMNLNSHSAWEAKINASTPLTDISQLKNWLLDIKWTPELAVEWQQFYNDASRIVALSTETQTYEILPKIPEYEDLKQEQCIRGMFDVNSSSLMMLDCNSAPVHKTFILFTVFPFLTTLFLAA